MSDSNSKSTETNSTKYSSIGFVGFGNMGSAIGKSLTSSSKVLVLDHGNTSHKNAQEIGAQSYQNLSDLINNSDLLILGIEPKHAEEVLQNISQEFENLGVDKPILSIVAGLKYQKIFSINPNFQILTSLPNIGFAVNQGLIAFTKETTFTESQKTAIFILFSKVSQVFWLSELELPAFSVTFGSSPAFLAKFLNELDKNGRKLGLKSLSDQEMNQALTDLALGTAKYLQEFNLSPDQLVEKVATKGGSTIEGITVLNAKSPTNPNQVATFSENIALAFKASYEKLSKLV